jgi:hypothetical protein
MEQGVLKTARIEDTGTSQFVPAPPGTMERVLADVNSIGLSFPSTPVLN